MATDGLTDTAITAALQKDWHEAVKLNKLILEKSPTDIQTLNRLGFALLKLGKYTGAKQYFKKVLDIDPYNTIAQNNLKKLSVTKKISRLPEPSEPVSPLLFLEEPGKTKIVECVHPASASVLSGLFPGQEIILKCKKHSIDVRDSAGAYIGSLPDDLSFRLIKYIRGGNTYCTHIKHVTKSCIQIFIRETERAKRFALHPSFTGGIPYTTWSRDDSEEKRSEKEKKETEEES